MLELLWPRDNHYQSTRESTTYLFGCFKLLGLTSSQKWQPLYYAYAIVSNFGFIFFMILTFNLSYFLLSDRMSISQLLCSLQVAINVMGLPFKVGAIKCYLKRLKATEDIMDILDARCHTKDELRRIRECATFCNRLTIYYIICYSFSCVLTYFCSLAMGHPPYAVYMLPLDWRNSWGEFFVQSSIEFMLMSYICFHQSMTDGYSVVYISIIRTHMQLLVERVKRLASLQNHSKEQNYVELVACIKDHQNILTLYNQISAVISVTIFSQFTITALILCTIMINILIFADTSDQIASASYFLCVLAQTTPCCFQATCLAEDCQQLPLAIFHCNWLQEDKRFRKMLSFFIQRSQRPLTLTALKLFPINLQTNISIAKFSFSLYALIQTFELGSNLKS